MNKITSSLLPILALILFIILMNSGDYLRQPRGTADNFEYHLAQLRGNIQTSDWETAELDAQRLSNAWKTIIPRIQFSVEKDEINAINVNLARLKAYLANRQTDGALVEISEAQEHWDNLNH